MFYSRSQYLQLFPGSAFSSFVTLTQTFLCVHIRWQTKGILTSIVYMIVWYHSYPLSVSFFYRCFCFHLTQGKTYRKGSAKGFRLLRFVEKWTSSGENPLSAYIQIYISCFYDQFHFQFLWCNFFSVSPCSFPQFWLDVLLNDRIFPLSFPSLQFFFYHSPCKL